MIVEKPIGPIKIEGIITRLSIGKPVPEFILKYWEKTKQLDKLIKNEVIIDEEERIKQLDESTKNKLIIDKKEKIKPEKKE